MSRFLLSLGLIALLSAACSTTTPEPEPAPVEQPAPEPQPIPVAKPPPPAPAPEPEPVAVAEPMRLPETASSLPGIGLAGTSALLVAGLLHAARRFFL